MTHIPADDATTRTFLRHTLATLAYRSGKTVRGTPAEFASFRLSPDSQTPAQILAHMGDLMDWGLSQARGKQAWRNSTPLAWDREVERWFESLRAFDDYLASGEPIRWEVGRLFQGGIADALTHTGQLAMLRRLSGYKMKGENYSVAGIEAGRVGLDQSPPDPKNEFD